MPMLLTISAAVGYLFGSIPTGYLAGRWAGKDVRRHGSGNIGATNVLRVLGKRYGYAVFAIDVAKGLLPVRLAYLLATHVRSTPHPEYYAISAAVGAVLGHSFPVWLSFRGGKGVATSAGVLLGMIPIAAIIALALWAFIFWTTRYVSVASVLTALALPLVVAVLLRSGYIQGAALLYFCVPVAVLVAWRHRANISRLLAGTEPRFTRK